MYALSFWYEALSTLDVALVAVERFPPRRRCAIHGALLHMLLVSTFLPPLLDADFRGQPHFHFFATEGNRVLSKVRLGRRNLETRGRRLPGWWLTCRGSKASRTAFGSRNTSTFLNWRPASFEDWWTEVSEIVVCSVWSTAESFSDQCARDAPAAGGLLLANNLSLDLCWVPS